jgi:hypothetical protein
MEGIRRDSKENWRWIMSIVVNKLPPHLDKLNSE